MKINLKDVEPATWVRIIVLIIALVNAILMVIGKSPINIDEGTVNEVVELLYKLFSSVLLAASSLWGAWKNNDFTEAAHIGSEIMREIKANKQ